MKNLIKLSQLFLILILSASQVKAGAIIDSIHYNWMVYELLDDPENDENKQCYIASFPQNSNTSHTSQRNPYIMITRFFNDKSEEVSVSAGYEFKINSKARILIDDNEWSLFTNASTAWLNNSFLDHEVIEEMLNARLIKVRSDSAIGTYAVDEYSTKGLTRAYKRMKVLCP